MYRTKKARMDIFPPQRHQTAMRQKSDHYDHPHLCHIHEPTPCPRENHHLDPNDNDSDTIKPQPYHLNHVSATIETVHCHFCPHFQDQKPNLKMNNVEPSIRVQHHKICSCIQHKRQRIQHQPQARSPDLNGSKERHHHHRSDHHYTQRIHSNDREHQPPKVKHFHSKSSNDPFDRVRHHTPPEALGTYARATARKSHEDGCDSNMKAVRFEEDDKKPGYAEAGNSNCPIHHVPPPVKDWHHSHRNRNQHQSQSRESRTYRWVWGPPLPVTARHSGNIYYPENYGE